MVQLGKMRLEVWKRDWTSEQYLSLYDSASNRLFPRSSYGRIKGTRGQASV